MELNWAEFKGFVQARSLSIQWFELNDIYLMKAFDGGLIVECRIPKTPVTADTTDFEDNFKDDGNDPLTLKEDDPHVSGERGPLILGVRNDNDADLTDTNLDRSPIATSKEGWAKTEVKKLPAVLPVQGLSKKLRYAKITANQSLTNGSYVTVYTYSGSGVVFGFYLELTATDADIKVSVDSEVIIDGINTGDLPQGTSHHEPSVFFWATNNQKYINFKPPHGIQYASQVKIEVKVGANNKKAVFGYVTLTKEA
jgi:hypothetical protein